MEEMNHMTTRSMTCSAAAALFAGVAAWTLPAHAQATPADCEAAAKLSLPGYDLTIDTATHVTEAPVPHCLVQGAFERRTGADGKPYAIGFAIALPDDWQGRFLVQGGGGLNGVVRPPLGDTAAGDRPALARGFAVLSHDSGHKGEVWDGSFKADQIATLNFAGWSVEKATGLGKALVEAYYGRAAEHSYFAGCSTGGREGLASAQRFPTLFDGIISGAPAMRTSRSNMALAAKAVAMNRISPAGAGGAPDRSAAFSDADRALVLDGILKACDGLDGLEDGMIQNSQACSFDPSTLVCKGNATEGCLSAEQAEVVAMTFAPTLDASGRPAYVGYPFDTGVMSTTDPIPGLLRFDDERNRQFKNAATEFDVDAAVEKADIADPQQRLINVDQWTDLSSFAATGRKIMLFHGMSDPWFSANDTIDFFGRVKAGTKTEAPMEDWAQLYLVPGMSHCRGGPAGLDRFDLLTPLVEWVENDAAPAGVVASGAAFEGRTRPLCPYPAHAHYTGSGDTQDAANFACQP
jgi:feruloyl esterase